MATVEQLFEQPAAGSAAAEGLPDIALRPDSASQTTRTRSTSRIFEAQSSSSASSATPAAAAPKAAPVTFPMSASAAVEKYRRVLTSYEQQEILNYPMIYFLAPLARKIQSKDDQPNSGFDDDKGRYKCIKNDHVGYRYEILKGLGKGSFGDVVKTYDHKTKSNMALKIIRNEKRFHKQGQIEVKILDQLRKLDKRGTHNVIHMADFFLFRNHLCITFELLNTDLYSALKKDNFKGFALPRVQLIAQSILQCLRVLRHNKIIHCDLKPENILLVSEDSDDIKIIDFGSSCLDHQKIHTYIQSRFYRSPEVILGGEYGTPIDMWSLGCILAELHTGHPIFPGHDEREQLMYQMEVLGAPSASFLDQTKRNAVFFNPDMSPRTMTDRKGRTHAPSTRPLARAVNSEDPLFLDFLQRCFTWDPAERMTPREAVKHPFIVGLDAPTSASDLYMSSSSVPASIPLQQQSSKDALQSIKGVSIDVASDAASTASRQPRMLPSVPLKTAVAGLTAMRPSRLSICSSTSSTESLGSRRSSRDLTATAAKIKLLAIEEPEQLSHIGSSI